MEGEVSTSLASTDLDRFLRSHSATCRSLFLENPVVNTREVDPYQALITGK